MKKSKALFPVLVSLEDKNVCILCGRDSDEKEVIRIARMLLPCTSHLTLLSPCPSEDLKRLSEDPDVCLTAGEYAREMLYGMDVVICALTTASEKDDVHAACRTLGIRLSILSEPGRSDFILQPS